MDIKNIKNNKDIKNIEKDIKDMELSPLGFGLMRVPMLPDGTFDSDVHDLIANAYESGVNFFDTAYLYLGGHSEELVRDALVARYPRDSFYISDKLPIWECQTADDMERIFQLQLKRLGTDYIDFYLLHGLNHNNWKKALELGALEFLSNKEKEGYIHKVGFSFHDEPKVLEDILEGYNWEFVLLQINYYDWFQGQAKTLYDMVEAKHISCFVMEPLGGGRLVKLTENAAQILKNEMPEFNAVSLALSFVSGLPNVKVVLSGMRNTDEIKQNIETTKQKNVNISYDICKKMVNAINAKRPLSCTGCMYCADKCSAGVDILQIFEKYIEFKQFEDAEPFDICYFRFITVTKNGGNCNKCAICNKHCPQKIDIPLELEHIHNEALTLFLGNSLENIKNRVSNGMKLVIFGAGHIGKSVTYSLINSGILPFAFCDNRAELWGTEVSGIKVISPSELVALYELHETEIAIATFYRNDVRTQLNEKGIKTLN